jgi:hypothetical protein
MFLKIFPIIPVRRRDLWESAEWVYELKHDGFRALAYLLLTCNCGSHPAGMSG